MERYKRVTSSRTSAPSIKQNEIRITAQGMSGSYISYAMSLFQEQKASEVVLTAMGRAINKAVMLAEILKRRIGSLHQNITLSSSDVKDVREPLEEGLETLEMVRHVSMISITLSTKELDVSSCGYQPPTFAKQVQPLTDSNQGEGGARGAGRTYGRGKGFERSNMRSGNGYDNTGDENWNPGRGEYRGRGRGYEVGGRGYNRGYPQADTRASNRGFVKNFPQTDTRGYNKGYPQAGTRGYGNAYPQADNRGQNSYYPQGGTRRYNGSNSQANMRGYNELQADAGGYNRPQRQYNTGHPQSFTGKYDNAVGDQNMAFRGRGRGAVGGSGRGRGRGGFGQ